MDEYRMIYYSNALKREAVQFCASRQDAERAGQGLLATDDTFLRIESPNGEIITTLPAR